MKKTGVRKSRDTLPLRIKFGNKFKSLYFVVCGKRTVFLSKMRTYVVSIFSPFFRAVHVTVTMLSCRSKLLIMALSLYSLWLLHFNIEALTLFILFLVAEALVRCRVVTKAKKLSRTQLWIFHHHFCPFLSTWIFSAWRMLQIRSREAEYCNWISMRIRIPNKATTTYIIGFMPLCYGTIQLNKKHLKFR